MSDIDTATRAADIIQPDAGEGDYVSFSLSINHLMLEDAAHGNAFGVRLPVVFSTQTAVEAVMAQLRYFEIDHVVLGQPGVLRLLASAEEKATIFILQGREGLTNILVDNALAETFLTNETINPGGTLLGAHAALVGLAFEAVSQAVKAGIPEEQRLLLAYQPD